MTRTENLFSPSQLHHELPLSSSQKKFIDAARQAIINILNGDDPRLLLIVGPCSIHDLKSAQEYAKRLKNLAEKFSSQFFIVMRTYFEKPRTCLGWKGFMSDPHLDDSADIGAGLKFSRKLLLDLAHLEMPTATEFLNPFATPYISDLISWGSIGARTTASQIHRQLASGLDMAIGFKNGTNGDLHIAVNAVTAAQYPHSFIGLNEEGKASIIRTKGNPHGHIILRGSEHGPNVDPFSINLALNCLTKEQLPLRLIVDCSHDNSGKNPNNQPSVFQNTLRQIIEGNRNIRGMILESFLHAGSQPIGKNMHPGISVTDPCIDWQTTEQIITWGAKQLSEYAKELVYQ